MREETQNLRRDDTNSKLERIFFRVTELHLLVKKSAGSPAPSDFGSPCQRYGAFSYVAVPNFSYCGKAEHSDQSCRKKMRDWKNCHFCGGMRHKQKERWTKQSPERQHADKNDRKNIIVMQDVALFTEEPVSAVWRRRNGEPLRKQRVVDRSAFNRIFNFSIKSVSCPVVVQQCRLRLCFRK